MTPTELVTTYGYPMVVLGAIVEGETFVMVGGYLAHVHQLPFVAGAGCAALGATLGDQFFFAVGRHWGRSPRPRWPRLARPLLDRFGPRAAAARDLVARHPRRALLSMRFLYGLRIALPVLIGASGISRRRFLAYNAGTGIVWALLFASLGYAFGAAAEGVVRRVARGEAVVLAALVAVVLLGRHAFVWLTRRRHATPRT